MSKYKQRSLFPMASIRIWATPLTIGSFFLMTGTGVVMFFRLDRGLITVVHQWFSWLFLLGTAGHIVLNLRPFKNHLKSRWGQASLIGFAVVLAMSFFSWGILTGPQLKRPIEEALVEAPLSTLARVTRITPEALLHKLEAQGISATEQQSIHDLAEANGVDENRLMAIVFLPE